MKKLISIFGPSEAQPGDIVYSEAHHLGALLAHEGYGIISGGYGGVMEAVSRGASSTGGKPVGITADVYYNRGREANEFISKEIRVKSHVDRLMELLDLADIYMAVGISPGTLVEVASAWEFIAKGFLEPKPIILVGDEWRALCDVLFTQEYYIGKNRNIKVVQTAEEAIDHLLELYGHQEKLPELEIVG
jgi:uncharacterized protein (TIGR00725 family)